MDIYLKLAEGTDEVHVSAQQIYLLLQPMLFEGGPIMERRHICMRVNVTINFVILSHHETILNKSTGSIQDFSPNII